MLFRMDFTLKYKGFVSEPIYLRPSGTISLESQRDLAQQALEMYVDEEESRVVKGDDFEGRIFTHGERATLGFYGGQIFKIDLDTNMGEDHIAFLLHERFRRDHQGDNYSN